MLVLTAPARNINPSIAVHSTSRSDSNVKPHQPRQWDLRVHEQKPRPYHLLLYYAVCTVPRVFRTSSTCHACSSTIRHLASSAVMSVLVTFYSFVIQLFPRISYTFSRSQVHDFYTREPLLHRLLANTFVVLNTPGLLCLVGSM